MGRRSFQEVDQALSYAFELWAIVGITGVKRPRVPAHTMHRPP